MFKITSVPNNETLIVSGMTESEVLDMVANFILTYGCNVSDIKIEYNGGNKNA